MLETIKTILFSTSILLLLFFYGHYILFKLLDLFNLKTEKQDIIGFVIFVAIIATYPAFISKWTAKLLSYVGVFGWVIVICIYVVCYDRFKRQVQHRNVLKKEALGKS